jgi:hypothetical protein
MLDKSKCRRASGPGKVALNAVDHRTDPGLLPTRLKTPSGEPCVILTECQKTALSCHLDVVRAALLQCFCNLL